ncbi:MAG: MFS transporter [bacterium]
MTGNNKNPWSFIPTQYFAEGLPYVIVNTLSVAMFKSLGVSNELIGMTSLLYLPWAIKFLWGPFVDANLTKRKWLIMMQLLLGICFAVVAFIIQMPNIFLLSIIIFTIIAFLSATHDIATDGYYLHALDQKEQAFFTGIRSTFYRFSKIFGSGLLLALAGWISTNYSNNKFGWTITFIISASLFFFFYLYHGFILPYPLTDQPVRNEKKNISSIPFIEVFKEYFKQPMIGVILAFILLYRLGEGLLEKMAQPFLIDPYKEGGLKLSEIQVGLMYGTFGVMALLAGGILGGWLIKKYSLKKLIWGFAFAMNLPNLLYAYMAYFTPDILTVQLCIILEQFGYGLGFTAFMVYLLYISRGKFKTSHYAISTGIMAVGMMLPGFFSGFLQQEVGYFWLFVLSFLFTIPGMLTIFFLPIYESKD